MDAEEKDFWDRLEGLAQTKEGRAHLALMLKESNRLFGRQTVEGNAIEVSPPKANYRVPRNAYYWMRQSASAVLE